jgi:hypothetical protein
MSQEKNPKIANEPDKPPADKEQASGGTDEQKRKVPLPQSGKGTPGQAEG